MAMATAPPVGRDPNPGRDPEPKAWLCRLLACPAARGCGPQADPDRGDHEYRERSNERETQMWDQTGAWQLGPPFGSTPYHRQLTRFHERSSHHCGTDVRYPT